MMSPVQPLRHWEEGKQSKLTLMSTSVIAQVYVSGLFDQKWKKSNSKSFRKKTKELSERASRLTYSRIRVELILQESWKRDSDSTRTSSCPREHPSLPCRLSPSISWDPGWPMLPVFKSCCSHQKRLILSLILFSKHSREGCWLSWLMSDAHPWANWGQGGRIPRGHIPTTLPGGVETPGSGPPNALCDQTLTDWLGCHTLV